MALPRQLERQLMRGSQVACSARCARLAHGDVGMPLCQSQLLCQHGQLRGIPVCCGMGVEGKLDDIHAVLYLQVQRSSPQPEKVCSTL